MKKLLKALAWRILRNDYPFMFKNESGLIDFCLEHYPLNFKKSWTTPKIYAVFVKKGRIREWRYFDAPQNGKRLNPEFVKSILKQ